MKNLIKICSFLLLLSIAVAGCKKDENKVVFQNGTAPVATSSLAGSVVLEKAKKDVELLRLSWTNPGYSFNTGVSSQDVLYAIQVDTVGGAKFATFATSKIDLSKSFSQGEFNNFLVKAKADGGLGLVPSAANNLRIRVKSYLGSETATNPTNLYSNEMMLKVTPYSVDPDLWITGTAVPSDYTNTPPQNQKFAYDRVSNTFTIIKSFVPGKEYKLLTISGAWQPQWGGAPATGGTIVENPGGGSDPSAIPTPSVAGDYKLTVSLSNKTITVVKQ